jgi:UrcA family protein
MNYGKAIAICGASLLAAVAVGAAAFPLHAGTPRVAVVGVHPEIIVERRIGYADLNLAAAAGERTLNRRVTSAIRDLCDEAVAGSRTGFEYMACSTGAWSGARPQVALAVQRAREIAVNGSSPIAAVAITIAAPK